MFLVGVLIEVEQLAVAAVMVDEQFARMPGGHLVYAGLDARIRRQVDRIRAHPWIKEVPVTGVVYEVETGRLRKVA